MAEVKRVEYKKPDIQITLTWDEAAELRKTLAKAAWTAHGIRTDIKVVSFVYTTLCDMGVQ